MSTLTPDGASVPAKHYRRSLLINNLVAAVIASTLMVFFHELAHLVAGLALGYPGTLFAFGVSHHGDPSMHHEVIMALAGPAFSLVTGVVLAIWMPLRRQAHFGHLVWMWFAFTSIQEGVAYLCLTPFGVGDRASLPHFSASPSPCSSSPWRLASRVCSPMRGLSLPTLHDMRESIRRTGMPCRCSSGCTACSHRSC